MKDDGLTFVTNEFAEALRQTVELSSREMPEVVNGIARKLCAEAAKKAKTANMSSIKRWDPNPPSWKRAGPGQRRYRNRVLYPVAMNGTKLGRAKKGQGIKELVTHMHNRRISARGYNKALWYHLMKQLGAKLKGKFNIGEGKTAVEKATELDPAANLELLFLDLTLRERCYAQLREAMPKVIEAMKERTNKKLAKIMEQHSGK